MATILRRLLTSCNAITAMSCQRTISSKPNNHHHQFEFTVNKFNDIHIKMNNVLAFNAATNSSVSEFSATLKGWFLSWIAFSSSSSSSSRLFRVILISNNSCVKSRWASGATRSERPCGSTCRSVWPTWQSHVASTDSSFIMPRTNRPSCSNGFPKTGRPKFPYSPLIRWAWLVRYTSHPATTIHISKRKHTKSHWCM